MYLPLFDLISQLLALTRCKTGGGLTDHERRGPAPDPNAALTQLEDASHK